MTHPCKPTACVPGTTYWTRSLAHLRLTRTEKNSQESQYVQGILSDSLHMHLFRLLGSGLDLLCELLQLLREGGAKALDRSLDPVDAQLVGELVFFEQVLVARCCDRFRRLDRDRAVMLEAGRGRDQLADDHVLLQANEFVPFALEGGVGEHLGRLLEGGCGKERFGRKRGLGDPEDDLLAFGSGTALFLDFFVQPFEAAAILELPGQEAGRALR